MAAARAGRRRLPRRPQRLRRRGSSAYTPEACGRRSSHPRGPRRRRSRCHLATGMTSAAPCPRYTCSNSSPDLLHHPSGPRSVRRSDRRSSVPQPCSLSWTHWSLASSDCIPHDALEAWRVTGADIGSHWKSRTTAESGSVPRASAAGISEKEARWHGRPRSSRPVGTRPFACLRLRPVLRSQGPRRGSTVPRPALPLGPGRARRSGAAAG